MTRREGKSETLQVLCNVLFFVDYAFSSVIYEKTLKIPEEQRYNAIATENVVILHEGGFFMKNKKRKEEAHRE